jgi:hypothetical protein
LKLIGVEVEGLEKIVVEGYTKKLSEKDGHKCLEIKDQITPS